MLDRIQVQGVLDQLAPELEFRLLRQDRLAQPVDALSLNQEDSDLCRKLDVASASTSAVLGMPHLEILLLPAPQVVAG